MPFNSPRRLRDMRSGETAHDEASARFLQAFEAPIRDVLRLGYSQMKDCDPAVVNLLAVNHWMVWREAFCAADSGVYAYHKLLFRQLAASGVNHVVVPEFDSMVLNESIDLVLRRDRSSPLVAAGQIRYLIAANTRVLLSYMRLSAESSPESVAARQSRA